MAQFDATAVLLLHLSHAPGAPDNEVDLWKWMWETLGVCTGKSIRDYFTFIAQAFTKYNVNVSVSLRPCLPGTGTNRAHA